MDRLTSSSNLKKNSQNGVNVQNNTVTHELLKESDHDKVSYTIIQQYAAAFCVNVTFILTTHKLSSALTTLRPPCVCATSVKNR
jgi:hypothetical protein